MNYYRVAALIFFVFALYPYFSGEFAMSVIPGWHTVIFPYLTVATIAMSAWIFLLATIYVVLNKRKPLSSKNIKLHTVFTIIPFVLIETQPNWLPKGNEAEAIFSFMILAALCVLFAIAQLWFVLLVAGKLVKQKRGN